jgi:hypothetical protein
MMNIASYTDIETKVITTCSVLAIGSENLCGGSNPTWDKILPAPANIPSSGDFDTLSPIVGCLQQTMQ